MISSPFQDAVLLLSVAAALLGDGAAAAVMPGACADRGRSVQVRRAQLPGQGLGVQAVVQAGGTKVR